MSDYVKISQLRAALQRESNKLKRQEEAIAATKAMIEMINAQIASEEKKK